MFSWQDARTAAEVEDLRQLVDADEYYAQSGLPLGTTWIVTKLLWMRKHEPALYARTHKFVQNQDLVLRAFGADDFYTDLCCMPFYGVWDVRRATWNESLLDKLDLTPRCSARPTRPGTQVGAISAAVAEQTGFAAGTPICVGGGDQNCSVVGMGAIRPGMATVTLGTAGLAILSTARPAAGFGGMMITHHAAPAMWEIEGLSNAAAAALRWYPRRGRHAGEGAGSVGRRGRLSAIGRAGRGGAAGQQGACCSCPTWPRRPRRAGTRKRGRR